MLPQVLHWYQPGAAVTADTSVHVLAAMGTPLSAHQAAVCHRSGLMIQESKAEQRLVLPHVDESCSLCVCARLQWDVGQDHLLAQRRHRPGGDHPLPQISLLLLQKCFPT